MVTHVFDCPLYRQCRTSETSNKVDTTKTSLIITYLHLHFQDVDVFKKIPSFPSCPSFRLVNLKSVGRKLGQLGKLGKLGFFLIHPHLENEDEGRL